MIERDRGVTTILFTDQVGSSSRAHAIGDDAAEALRRVHFQLLREALIVHGGEEVKNVGDGLMVVFRSAVDAIACAETIQRRIREHNARATTDQQLDVKIGLDVGSPTVAEGDYFGTPVIVASRLCALAQGGRILTTQTLQSVAGSRGGHEFRRVGPRTLKGFPEPLDVVEVVWSESSAGAGGAPPPLAPQFDFAHRTRFIGRETELRLLNEGWLAAQTCARLIAVEGEAGIGKTRLVTQFGAWLRESGVVVSFIRCEVPLESPGISAPERSYERALVLAIDAAGAAPSVILIDDAQWADSEVLRAISRVMRSGARVLIAATYRPGETTKASGWPALVAELQREGLVQRVRLRGLDEAGVAALVEAWAGAAPPAKFVRAVADRSEGNPFFVEEILRSLAETGGIRERDGLLEVPDDVEDMGVPQTVRDTVAARAERLTDDCQSLLSAASVAGREFDRPTLERMYPDMEPDRILGAMEEAVSARLIHEQASGTYAFSHALVRESFHEALSLGRRTRLHAQTIRYATREDVRLAYEVLGTSGPYIAVVGLTACVSLRARAASHARRWDRVAQFARVLLYDRRGLGYSTATEHGYSIDNALDDVTAVLDDAGAESVFVWGGTDGGPFALAYAAQHPERVAGLILLGTTATVLSRDGFPHGFNQDEVESFSRTYTLDPGRAASELMELRRQRLDNKEITSEFIRRAPPAIWRKSVVCAASIDARPLLPDLQMPALIIHDAGNTYLPVGAAYYLHEHLAGSELLITDEASAATLGPDVYGAIESFIDRVTVGPMSR